MKQFLREALTELYETQGYPAGQTRDLIGHTVLEWYQDHVDRLARDLGCRVVQKPRIEGMMHVEEGWVTGPTIVDQLGYLTMLHELGHFALDHTQGRPPYGHLRRYFDEGVLHSEAAAWDWALDQCCDKIEVASRFFMWDYCLGSYYQASLNNAGRPDRLGNGNRHHVEFVYDEPDEYFAKVVQRIQGDIRGFGKTFHGYRAGPQPWPVMLVAP